MAYEFTFTPRFQKHLRNLTAREKNQLKLKLKLLAENPSHPSLRAKRIQLTICARVSAFTEFFILIVSNFSRRKRKNSVVQANLLKTRECRV